MDREKNIISPFLNRINGDDAALVGDHFYSCDYFCEDVHFKRAWMSYEQIGQKAMLVNISDAIVMNGQPKYALLAIGIPKYMKARQIKALSLGIMQVAKEYGIQIIGGDTIHDEKLNICITIIAKKNKKAVFRRGLKRGDLLAFTGKLGEVKKGLDILYQGGKLAKTHRFIRPILRQDFFYQVAPKLSVAMDISDGLAKDLSRLLDLNKLGVSFIKKLSDFELYSGEEYELLLGFDPRYALYFKALARKKRLDFNIFAKVCNKRYIFHGKEHHF